MTKRPGKRPESQSPTDARSSEASGDRSVAVRDIHGDVITGDTVHVHVPSEAFLSSSERADTILAYLIDQFQRDATLKFKQTDLESQAVQQLFIDLPLVKMNSRYYDESSSGDTSSKASIPAANTGESGAAHLLLSDQLKNTTIAVFGGPGGGKSTLLQYVSQVYRAIMIDSPEFLAQIPPTHAAATPRMPLRCDLKDLAQWFSGGDPYSIGNETGWRAAGPEGRSLEGLLAHAIRCSSGGGSFTVDDLRVIFRTERVLLALDGLDEVASPSDRRTVADEIGIGVARLKGIAKDLVVVVTSRPTADPAKHLLPTRFAHYRIGALDATLAEEYLHKWLMQRQLGQKDAEDLLNVYHDRSSEPHVSYLTRSPMQLAILLHLMHTRGYSLPGLRTLMYEDYVRLFFDREATKSVAVRDNRSLLESLHNFLAWTLQHRAESNPQGGRIEQGKLRDIIRNHLSQQELPTEAVEDVFSASTQRILMLVERIEGTYEFEVQPIREFFAARYLHVTAPYAQVGAENSSTRGSRLAELCLHPYWLNTVRFLAGFFQEGELADLVDVLIDLAQSVGAPEALYIREVLVLLLQDQIFSRKPRAMRRAFESLLLGNDLTIRVLASQDVPMVFDAVGTRQALDVLLERLYFTNSDSQIADIAMVIKRISSRKANWWLEIMPGDSESYDKWLQIGARSGALQRLKSIKAVWPNIESLANVGDTLVLGNVNVHQGDIAAEAVFDSICDGASWSLRADPRSALGSLITVIRPGQWLKPFTGGRVRRDQQVIQQTMGNLWSPGVGALLQDQLTMGEFDEVKWIDILEKSRAIFGDCLAARRLAIAAAARRPSRGESNDAIDELVFNDSSPSLLFRALSQHPRDAGWWLNQRSTLAEEWQIASWLIALAMLPPDGMTSLGPYVEADLATLSQRFANRVIHAVHEDADFCSELNIPFPLVGPRTTCLLSRRFLTKRDDAWRRIAERPEFLANVMSMGEAARVEAVFRLMRTELGNLAYQGGKKLSFLEMLGPDFIVPARLLEELRFTADERRRLFSEPYRWPQDVVVRAASWSPAVDEARPSVAEVSVRMGWF
jgi:hypothetical protein